MPTAFKAHHSGEFLVYAQMPNDRKVKAKDAKGVPIPGLNCGFTIEKHDGDHVALRSCWLSIYLAVSGASVVLADDAYGGAKKKECIFHLDRHPDHPERVAIRGHHGKYISLHHGQVEFRHASHHTEIWFEQVNVM